MLNGEEATRATEADLHFVKDQEQAKPPADLLRTHEERLGRQHVAAFAQDSLDEDGVIPPSRRLSDELHLRVLPFSMLLALHFSRLKSPRPPRESGGEGRLEVSAEE